MYTSSYAPLLCYCNMFTVYYLEVISNTKLLAKKVSADSSMGKKVNYIICGFYIFLFLCIWILQLVNPSDMTSIEVYYIKCWYFKQKPWQSPETRKFTVFDISQITLSVVMFIFVLMNMFVAKESIMIFTHEAVSNGFSLTMDQ